MAKKTVIRLNHTLEEYNKKYGEKHGRVINKVDADKDNSLIEGRAWWLIEDKYYEIPQSKCPPVNWWKNLSTTGRVITCILGAGVVATAVAVPVALTMNQSVEYKAVVDPAVSDICKVSQKRLDNGALQITMTYDSSKELTGLEVFMGNAKLTLNQDYVVEGDVIVVAADALAKYGTKEILIKPTFKDKAPTVTGIIVSKAAKKTTYVVGENLNLDGMEITAQYEGGTSKVVTSECTTNPASGTKLDKTGEIEITITHTPSGVSCLTTVTVNEKGKVSSEQWQSALEYLFKTNVADRSVTVSRKEGEALKSIFYLDDNQEGLTEDGTKYLYSRMNNNYCYHYGSTSQKWEIDKEGMFEFDETIEPILVNINAAKDSFQFKDGKYTWEDTETKTKYTLEFNVDENQNAFLTSVVIVDSTGLSTTLTFDNYEATTVTGMPAWPDKPFVDFITIDITGIKQHSVNDALDLTGITIEAHSSDGSEKALDKKDVTFDPAEGTKLTESGEKTIVATYNDGYSDVSSSFLINVNAPSKVDWSTRKVDGTNTLYNLATTATKIVIGTNEKYKITAEGLSDLKKYNGGEADVPDGEITAYYGKNNDDNFELYVLSDKKIAFGDNDFVPINAETSGGPFCRCSKANYIILDNIDTCSLTSMFCMFYNCISLIELDVSKFNTSNVTNMANMFNGCPKISSLDLSSFDTSKVTDMECMFMYCEGLVSLNISSFDTSEVTNMDSMFKSCDNLTALNLSKFNTKKVLSMNNMFSSCKKLVSLDLSSFDTSEVTNMSNMFYLCESLTNLNISKLNTSKVKNINSMFYHCQKLVSLDLTNFDTAQVENMSHMFSGCIALKSLDLSSFDTSLVTNMSFMFSACRELVSLDLSSFNTKNVSSMSQMFDMQLSSTETTKLETIYVDPEQFVTDSVTSSENMFSNCLNLVGGSGTTYDASKIDKKYAHVDGGASNPGYFTEKKVEKTANLVLDSSFDKKLKEAGWKGVALFNDTISKTDNGIMFTYETAGEACLMYAAVYNEDGTCVQTSSVLFEPARGPEGEIDFFFTNFDKISNGCTLTIKEAKTVSIDYECAEQSGNLSIKDTGRTGSIAQGGEDINFIVINKGTETIIPTVEVYNDEGGLVALPTGYSFGPDSATPTSISNSEIDWDEVKDGSTIKVWIS